MICMHFLHFFLICFTKKIKNFIDFEKEYKGFKLNIKRSCNIKN